MNETHQFTVTENEQDIRLDVFLAEKLTDITRNRVQYLIKNNFVTSQQKTIDNCSYRVKPDDQITITIPEPQIADIKPADIPLNIVFEDDDIIVIDKPAGLTVHPGAGNHQDTLVNALKTTKKLCVCVCVRVCVCVV